MRHLFKKLVIPSLTLMMIIQMTGTVFAASSDWEENGKYYSAYVNKSGDQIPQYVCYSGTAKQHTYGTKTDLILTPGKSVTSTGTESFSSSYSSRLYTCMSAAGLFHSLTAYSKETIVILTVPAGAASGTYSIAQHFVGYAGNWGVVSSKTSDGPRTYVTSGTFSWAPSDFYSQPMIYPKI